jgi:hypothetical protein
MNQPLDYSQFKSEFLIPWQDLYDNNKSYPDNILALLPKVSQLPFDFQYKMLASYIMCPSALANILPIMIFYGQRGTGKSSMGQFISYMHNVEINTGADTFASLRNILNERRWGVIYVPHQHKDYLGTKPKTIELNTILIWDDIDAKVLIEQPNIFRMLKSGYNKATDCISIADVGGKNLKFNCFSPKICSTTSPIWGQARFAELERRILVIKFGKAIATDLLRLEDYDWIGFGELFHQYWQQKKHIKAWISQRRNVSKSFENTTKNTILLDIVATGLSCGYWESTEEAKDYFTEYWNWYADEVFHGNSALCGLLKKWIEEYHQQKEPQLSLFKRSEQEINPMSLKRKITEWQAEGMLETTPTAKVINETMNYLGYQLVPGKWVKMR